MKNVNHEGHEEHEEVLTFVSSRSSWFRSHWLSVGKRRRMTRTTKATRARRSPSSCPSRSSWFRSHWLSAGKRRRMT